MFIISFHSYYSKSRASDYSRKKKCPILTQCNVDMRLCLNLDNEINMHVCVLIFEVIFLP